MNVDEHERNMRLAMEQAEAAGASGNIAVGSVIVREGAVLGAGYNDVGTSGDLIAHAEVCAIRNACTHLSTTALTGATLYTTMEPCPMCLWAICIANIERLVLGARHATYHRPELGGYTVEGLLAMTGAPVEVVTDVLTGECEGLRPEINRR